MKAQAAICLLLLGALAPAAAAPAAPPVALLAAVSVSRATGVDRVMFTFRSRPVSVRVGYAARSALVGPSGREIPVTGSAFLLVVFRAASGVDLSRAAPVTTYRGPKRISTGERRGVQEVRELEDFEGVLRFAVGLSERHAFTVTRAGPRVTVTFR